LSAHIAQRSCLAQRARKIDALTRISTSLTAMRQEWQQWESERDTTENAEISVQATPTTVAPTTPVLSRVETSPREPLSSSGTRSSSANWNPSMPGTRSSTGSLSKISKKFFGPHIRTKVNLNNIPFESAITPDGRYLAVWHKPQLAICETARHQWELLNIEGDIRLVSMSTDMMFVVSSLAGVSLIDDTDQV